MGSTSVSWEVTSLEVQTTTPSATSDGLYANGNMQVPVVVVIKTIDPDTNTSYQLIESDLETIKLIDYDDPPTELSGSWSYSTTENEWGFPKEALLGYDNKGGEQESRREHQTAQWDLTYKLDDINLRKGDTTSGTGETVASQKWSRTNYYLTTNKYPLRKADVNGYTLRTDQGVENSYLENAMACFPSGSNELDIFYYWPMGPEETRRLGGASGAPIEITVNEESNALCFTHMHLQNYDFGWIPNFLFDYRFTFYDQFGNPGTFWVGYNDSHTTLEILDHKYTADDYGHDA
ncbi:hypothetical protein AnigIFM50267_008759 [Aspergillus niger]|nr:hypothetical protein AnigIFM50267_008759 [Aspergillus niger]